MKGEEKKVIVEVIFGEQLDIEIKTTGDIASTDIVAAITFAQHSFIKDIQNQNEKTKS